MNRYRGMRPPRKTRYITGDFDERDGLILETNGNLSLIEDVETGEVDWKAPFELNTEPEPQIKRRYLDDY